MDELKDQAVRQIFARLERALKAFEDVWLPENQTGYRMVLAKRNAARKNKKADEAAPLLASAGLVEHITGEHLKERYDERNQDYAEHLVESERKWAEKARRRVMAVANQVSVEALLEMEAYRVRTYPPIVAYDLEYWKKQRSVILGLAGKKET